MPQFKLVQKAIVYETRIVEAETREAAKYLYENELVQNWGHEQYGDLELIGVDEMLEDGTINSNDVVDGEFDDECDHEGWVTGGEYSRCGEKVDVDP